MGIRAPWLSLTAYAGYPMASLTIAGLIVADGIGFLPGEDTRTNKLHLRAHRLQSKEILCVAFVLSVLPAAGFYFLSRLIPCMWANGCSARRSSSCS